MVERRYEQQNTHEYDEDEEQRLDFLPGRGPALLFWCEMEVEDARDTIGEPAGEESSDDAEEVIEERDTGRVSARCEVLGELSDLQFCNDERSGPFAKANANPSRPASEGMRGHVS